MTDKNKKSSVAAAGVIFGVIAVGLSAFMALTANSLALWADFSATLLDCIAIAIAWIGFKKIEGNSTEVFDYGFGKFESLSSLAMAALMVLSFSCIMTVAVIRFIYPVAVSGIGVFIGIGLHLIFGAINGTLYLKSIKLHKQQSSSLLLAQCRIYLMKGSANFVMFVSLLLSCSLHHFAWAMYLDPLAATLIALMILTGATKIFRHSSLDLLDYALEEQSQLLIMRALATHFDLYENIQKIRTRVSGGKTYVELFLEFDGEIKHDEVMQSIVAIQLEITDLLRCDEVLIIPVPPTLNVSTL